MSEYQNNNDNIWDKEYRGKNYSPRHRRYYRNNSNNKNNNNNSKRYKTRSPNRSPRHLKVRGEHYGLSTASSIKLPSETTPNLYFVIDQDRGQQTQKESEEKSYETKDGDCNEILLPNLPDFQLEQEELSCFRDIEISVIHSQLDQQRLQNGTILAQLHCDQDQFLNICQHYQNENDLLKQEILKYEQENETIIDQVQEIQNILIQHKNENMIENEEMRQSEIIKQHLWEAVNTNMQLLQQVNDLNKQIDSYHVLIAKKSQQLSILEKEKQEKKKNHQTKDLINDDDDDDNDDDDDDIDDDAISITTFNTTSNWFDGIGSMDQSDILKSYAHQLLSKNERYQEILTLLRNKVDQLRDTRTRL